MAHPKVSIIVPVYKVEKYLSQCMDSLLNQTLKDIEIILVDDGSPDNCPSMCDEYAKQDHRVKVIHKKNEGLGYARNSGLDIATGDFIAFVDSDDYIELNAYQKLYVSAINTKADVIYFCFQHFNEQGKVWGKTSSSKEEQYHTKDSIRELILNMIANRYTKKSGRDITCSACCALYRTNMIKVNNLKFISERELCLEELLFNLNFLLHSSNVIAVPDVYYNYRINPSSLTQTVRPDRIDKYFHFYKYLLEMLNKNNFGMEGYLRATRLFIDYSRDAIRKYIQSSLSMSEKKKWLKEVGNQNYWKEIASSFPYKKLPLQHALHYFLLHKGYSNLLYYIVAMYKSKKY